jgi:hypothetical protein
MRSYFIAYRRADSAGHAGRLRDWLPYVARDAQVFIDADIPAGENWRQVVEKSIAACDVFLAVIGPRFVDDTNGARLDEPDDQLRFELETALGRTGLLVIPVLVGGASALEREQLPETLAELPERNAVWLHDTSWRDSVERLAEVVSNHFDPRPPPPPPPPPDWDAWRETVCEDAQGHGLSLSADGAYAGRPLGSGLHVVDTSAGTSRFLRPAPPPERLRAPVFSANHRCVAAAATEAEAGAEAAWVWATETQDQYSLYAASTQSGFAAGDDVVLLLSRSGRYFCAPRLTSVLRDLNSRRDHDLGDSDHGAFASDEAWFAVASSSSLRFFDLRSFEVSEAPQPDPITGLDAHPREGEMLLIVGESEVSLHHQAEGRVGHIPVPPDWNGISARFSPTGRYLIVTETDGGYNHLFNTETQAELDIPSFQAHGFGPDDARIVVFTTGQATLCDLPTGKVVKEIVTDVYDDVPDPLFHGVSVDGRFIASGHPRPSIEPRGVVPHVHVWELRTGEQGPALGFNAYWAAFSREDRVFVAAGDQEVRAYRW